VGRSPTDRRLIDGLVGTIRTLFPSVYVIDVPNTFNSIIYATMQDTQVDNLYNNLIYLLSLSDVHPLLIHSIERTILNLQPTPESRTVFTDDRAPVEWITNSMVLSYVLFGDIDALK
jgi:hypothetical protein